MKNKEQAEDWVYVFVTGSEGNETFLGLYYEEKDVNFIPAFQTKDDANACFLTIPREKGITYQVQAIHIEELQEEASKNSFIVALVDQDGNVIK